MSRFSFEQIYLERVFFQQDFFGKISFQKSFFCEEFLLRRFSFQKSFFQEEIFLEDFLSKWFSFENLFFREGEAQLWFIDCQHQQALTPLYTLLGQGLFFMRKIHMIKLDLIVPSVILDCRVVLQGR